MSARERWGPRVDAVRHGGRATWWSTFVVVFALTGLWSLASPLSSAPDEPSHLNQAAAVWRGQLVADEVVSGDPGFPEDRASYARRLSATEVPAWVESALPLPNCFAFDAARNAGCAPELGGATETRTSYHQFGRYPPLYYALVGWPTTFLSGDVGYHAVRLVSAALAAGFVASAMCSALSLPGRRRVAALGVGMAVTPLAVFLFATVSSSGFEVAAALALWLSALELARRTGPAPRRLLLRVTVAAVALSWARPSGFAYAAALVALVALCALDLDRLRVLARDRRAQVAGAAVGLSLLGSAGWVALVRPDEGLLGVPMPGVSVPEAAGGSLERFPERVEQMIGVFGWLDAPLPTWAWGSWLAVVLATAAGALWLGTARQRTGLLVTAAVVVAVPLVLEIRAVAEVGYVWQGRYTLPLAIGLPVLAAWVVGDRVAARHDRAVAVTVGVVAVVVGVVQFVAHARALDRNMVGLPSGLFSYLSGGGWRPPLGPRLQFALAVVTTSAWAALVGWSAVGRGAPDAPGTGRSAGGDQPSSGSRAPSRWAAARTS